MQAIDDTFTKLVKATIEIIKPTQILDVVLRALAVVDASFEVCIFEVCTFQAPDARLYPRFQISHVVLLELKHFWQLEGTQLSTVRVIIFWIGFEVPLTSAFTMK